MRRLHALVRVLRKTALDQAVEQRRARRLDRGNRRRLRRHDRRDERRPARRGERFAPRRHFVQHRSESEDVGAGVDFLSFELFRGHVLDRTEDRSLLGQARLGGRRRIPPGVYEAELGPELLREPEVQKLHPRPGQHDVGRLQVSMHDPLPVGLVERVGDLDAEAQDLLERERALSDSVREHFALQVLHDEIVGTGLAANIVERADVRMRKLRDGLRFTLEALAHVGRSGEVVGKDFDGDRAVEPSIPRPVDFAHAARSHGRLDLVRSEAPADGEAHGLQRIWDPCRTSKLASARPWAICRAWSRTLAIGSSPRVRRARSVSPSSSSATKKAVPP